MALTQSRHVARLLEAAEPGLLVELVPIRTSGDEGGPAPRPSAPDDKSRFTKEIEEALLREDADIAVHSAKDVPGEIPTGLVLLESPERGDARDALCGAHSLEALPWGATVGTGSVRRRSQLLARRPDLRVEPLRGNVDTRLRRLAEGRFHALVLGTAGLRRLGLSDGAPLATEVMTPAPGQGALLLEGRAGDARVAELAARIRDPEASRTLAAERALVSVLEATCHTPVGAHAELGSGELVLSAFVGLPDGSRWIRDRARGSLEDPEALGREVARRLESAGASEVLAEAEALAPAGTLG